MVGVLAFPLQAAVLSAQDGVSILYINGQKAEQKIGQNQVEEGFVQTVVRFDDKLGSRVFTSKPYVISFDSQGENFKVVAPDVNSEMAAEQEFSKAAPSWKVLVDGQEIVFEQAVLEGKGGFMPYAGMENLVAEHNKQRGVYFKDGVLIDAPVAIETAAVATSSVVANGSSSTVAAPAPVMATKTVDQLKAWYLQANKEERKEFRRWMIDQE
ncbi:hypothetical protein PL18_17620 [Vibrio renipiscarius]|uniref:Uncharacterized protein n=2 Tax=Vibrio renipiscarius TaxID=1461322 RepID=A0A0C2P1D8_9VIBR|nr:hypothetical protein PL18_17620 [Vibrio renipiscarius]KII82115.1 hypothetical protein OJ16_02115 [Vibrio renipiscarius]